MIVSTTIPTRLSMPNPIKARIAPTANPNMNKTRKAHYLSAKNILLSAEKQEQKTYQK